MDVTLTGGTSQGTYSVADGFNAVLDDRFWRPSAFGAVHSACQQLHACCAPHQLHLDMHGRNHHGTLLSGAALHVIYATAHQVSSRQETESAMYASL